MLCKEKIVAIESVAPADGSASDKRTTLPHAVIGACLDLNERQWPTP